MKNLKYGIIGNLVENLKYGIQFFTKSLCRGASKLQSVHENFIEIELTYSKFYTVYPACDVVEIDLCTSQYKSPHPQTRDIAGNRIHSLC